MDLCFIHIYTMLYQNEDKELFKPTPNYNQNKNLELCQTM